MGQTMITISSAITLIGMVLIWHKRGSSRAVGITLTLMGALATTGWYLLTINPVTTEPGIVEVETDNRRVVLASAMPWQLLCLQKERRVLITGTNGEISHGTIKKLELTRKQKAAAILSSRQCKSPIRLQESPAT